MEEPNKKIIPHIGSFISICTGIILLIVLIPLVLSSLPSMYLKGDAPAEVVAEFDEYYDEFEGIKNFVLEKYSELPKSREGESGRTFLVEVDNGYITHSTYDEVSGTLLHIPFESDENIMDSIKKLKGFTEQTDGNMINVLDGTVRFIYWGGRIIYTPDNSIPEYNYHPREADEGYSIYRLRDNWYLAASGIL